MLPRTYYNEIDKFCAEWLYNLQRKNLIAPGDIDTRPIQDVRPSDLKDYTQCHFFAGIGGWSYALRQANWPDHRKVWTGSCPCQPFSLAGKRGGFADDRHLWPFWRYLIAVGRPATVFGEQVASAIEWLGLVRSDLEALEYAVGAMPIEAASAGADHLRDRFWFVANRAGAQVGTTRQPRQSGDVVNDKGERRGEGWPEHEVRSGRNAITNNGGVGNSKSFAQRKSHDESNACTIVGQTRSVFGSASANGDLSDSERIWLRGKEPETPIGTSGRMQGENGQRERIWSDVGPICLPEYEWVIGADGKTRRVKPGVRLLAHGVPNRVGKLRGFGNAIDPRPATAFIESVMEILPCPN